MQAKLSPNEKKAIEQPPTTDLAAFDLYSRARTLLLTAGFSATSEPDERKAIELLDEAVKHDPSFFDAYCQLAYAHEIAYAVRGYDHTPARLALAESAVQAATRLRPDAAETHLARAQYLYYGLRDYAGASPNWRSRGKRYPMIRALRTHRLHSAAARPAGGRFAQSAARGGAGSAQLLYSATDRTQLPVPGALCRGDRCAGSSVSDHARQRRNAGQSWTMVQCWKGDTRPLQQTIDAILAQGSGAIVSAADIWFFCALAERDPAAAERALVALGDNQCWNEGAIILSHSFGEGLLARMVKDEARARTAFEAARHSRRSSCRRSRTTGRRSASSA